MPPSTMEDILSQANNLSSDERRALAAALTASAAEGPVPSSPRRSAYGEYAGKLTPVDEFLRIKHEETSRDDKALSR